MKSAVVNTLVSKIGTALSVELHYIAADLRLVGYATLTRLDTGAGLGGKTVYLYTWKPDGTKITQSMKTPSSGRVATVHVPIDQHGVWKFQAEFKGDATYEACSASTSYDVPGISTTLTLIAEFSIDETPRITCYGYLTRADTGEVLAGEEVIIRFTRADGSTGEWRVTTFESGYYVKTWLPTVTPENQGVWTFQAEFVSKGMFLGCEEAEVGVGEFGW